MRHITMNGYTRISKAEAKRRFEEGKDVMLTPCLCRPNDKLFGLSIVVNIDDWGMEHINRDKRWDVLINEYTYYNCMTRGLGTYPAYYKEVN